jgi:hypothetical protein
MQLVLKAREKAGSPQQAEPRAIKNVADSSAGAMDRLGGEAHAPP